MPADEKLLKGYSEIKVKKQIKRCVLCGYDVESLFPITMIVNEKTWKKITEIATRDSNLRLIKTEFHVFSLTGELDDLNLNPINGMAYHVNIDFCRRCSEKVGHRHKYKGKHLNSLYATSKV